MDFLEDFSFIERYDTLVEEADNGEKKYILRGVFGKFGIPNKNKRIYPRPVMEQCVNELQSIIGIKGFAGELDHPPSPKMNIKEISHYITKLALAEDGAVIGEIIPASTPAGSVLKGLMKDHARLGVSTRGLGKVKPYSGSLGEGLVEVQLGYKMKAIDIVWDPSAGAYPDQVVESTDSGIILGSTANFRKVWENCFG